MFANEATDSVTSWLVDDAHHPTPPARNIAQQNILQRSTSLYLDFRL